MDLAGPCLLDPIRSFRTISYTKVEDKFQNLRTHIPVYICLEACRNIRRCSMTFLLDASAQQGTLATVCLPALFTLCLMAARAWIDVGHSPSLSTTSEEGTTCSNCHALFRIGACDGGIELETLALALLWRAARAAWSLVLRAVWLDAGDVAATTVTVTSLCSVAFIALPTFRALEDAERTYQVCGEHVSHLPYPNNFKPMLLKTSSNCFKTPLVTFLSKR